MKRKKYQLVIDDTEKALSLNPKNHMANYISAIGFSELGNPREAINAFTRAIKFAPAIGEYYYYRALEHEKVGEIEQAINDVYRGELGQRFGGISEEEFNKTLDRLRSK